MQLKANPHLSSRQVKKEKRRVNWIHALKKPDTIKGEWYLCLQHVINTIKTVAKMSH